MCRSDPLSDQIPDDETRAWAIIAARAADAKQATDVVVLERLGLRLKIAPAPHGAPAAAASNLPAGRS